MGPQIDPTMGAGIPKVIPLSSQLATCKEPNGRADQGCPDLDDFSGHRAGWGHFCTPEHPKWSPFGTHQKGPRIVMITPDTAAPNRYRWFECVSDYTLLLVVPTSFGSMRSLTLVLGPSDLVHKPDLKMGAGLARVRFRLYTFSCGAHRFLAHSVIAYDAGDPRFGPPNRPHHGCGGSQSESIIWPISNQHSRIAELIKGVQI